MGKRGPRANREWVAPPAGGTAPGEDARGVDVPLDELRLKFPEGALVAVRRWNNAEKMFESLGNVPLEKIDDDYMFDEFGPGQYELYHKDAAGHMTGNKTRVLIGKRARKPAFETAQAEAAARPAPAPIDASRAQVEMLKLELDANRQMMLRMVDAIAQRQETSKSNINELIEGLVQLRNLEKPATAPAPTFSEKLMERAFEMAAAGGAAKQPEDNSMFGFLREVWQEMKPQLINPPQQPASAPAPAASSERVQPATAAPAEEDMVEIDIGPAFESLKQHARANRPVEMVSDFIIAQAASSPDMSEVVAGMVEQPFEALVAIDNEIGAEPYVQWFRALHEALRVRFVGSVPDPQRGAGNGTHA